MIPFGILWQSSCQEHNPDKRKTERDTKEMVHRLLVSLPKHEWYGEAYFFSHYLFSWTTMLAARTNSPFANIISANPNSPACLAPCAILRFLLHLVHISVHLASWIITARSTQYSSLRSARNLTAMKGCSKGPKCGAVTEKQGKINVAI